MVDRVRDQITQADITYAEFDIKYNVEFGIVMDVEISICL